MQIKTLAKKILKIIDKKNLKIIFNNKNNDKRNYIVGSKIFKKIFGRKFKFSNFKYEVKNLYKSMKKYKTMSNTSTIRIKYYSKILK